MAILQPAECKDLVPKKIGYYNFEFSHRGPYIQVFHDFMLEAQLDDETLGATTSIFVKDENGKWKLLRMLNYFYESMGVIAFCQEVALAWEFEEFAIDKNKKPAQWSDLAAVSELNMKEFTISIIR